MRNKLVPIAASALLVTGSAQWILRAVDWFSRGETVIDVFKSLPTWLGFLEYPLTGLILISAGFGCLTYIVKPRYPQCLLVGADEKPLSRSTLPVLRYAIYSIGVSLILSSFCWAWFYFKVKPSSIATTKKVTVQCVDYAPDDLFLKPSPYFSTTASSYSIFLSNTYWFPFELEGKQHAEEFLAEARRHSGVCWTGGGTYTMNDTFLDWKGGNVDHPKRKPKTQLGSVPVELPSEHLECSAISSSDLVIEGTSDGHYTLNAGTNWSFHFDLLDEAKAAKQMQANRSTVCVLGRSYSIGGRIAFWE